MAAHTELNSKSDFDKALETKGKYVLIYAYEGSVSSQAEEYAKKFSGTVDAYKVDVSKQSKAKEYFSVSQTPTAIVYLDGEQKAKVEGMDPAKMQEVAAMLEKGA